MSTSALYPPHPAEGRTSNSSFEELTTATPWPVASAAEPVSTLLTSASAPHLDRRHHWLAYDPSTNGQYPLD